MPRSKVSPYAKEMLKSYMETALWSTTDNTDDYGGEPLDSNHSIDDIAKKTKSDMLEDCQQFYSCLSGSRTPQDR